MSVPEKLAAGVYSTDPSGFTAVIVPLDGAVTIVTDVGSTVPSSVSTSLTVTATTTGTSSSVVAKSSPATGASLTALTVTVTAPVAHSDGTPSSQMV